MPDKLVCASCASREYGVFKCVGSQTLTEVSQEKISLIFQKKDIIFRENENVTGFYCMETGIVRTYKTSKVGKIQTFQIVSKGKWLGFRDALSGLKYNHSAVCVEDVRACYISRETIVRLIKVDPEFQFEVLKYLAEEWKDIENHAHSLGTKQIHSRLAELLITFYNASDKDTDLTIHITRDVMATCIGTTKESLIRALADFKDRNWIKLEKNKIELLNLKLLYNLAEIEYS